MTIKPSTGHADAGHGALFMPKTPVMGESWTLHDVLPTAGETYQATVARVWRDDAGRLWARFESGEEEGKGAMFEVWLRQERQL